MSNPHKRCFNKQITHQKCSAFLKAAGSLHFVFPNKLITHSYTAKHKMVALSDPFTLPVTLTLKQSILDSLIHLTWPMLLQSLHSVFHSLQLFQFKGPATLLSLLCTVYRFLYPPSLLPRIDGEGEKLMTHLSNQFTQLCHTQYLSKPMRKE